MRVAPQKISGPIIVTAIMRLQVFHAIMPSAAHSVSLIGLVTAIAEAQHLSFPAFFTHFSPNVLFTFRYRNIIDLFFLTEVFTNG